NDEAGKPGQRPADHVDQQLDALDRNARQPRRLLVAADGDDLAADDGVADHGGGERDDDDHQHDLRRNAGDAAHGDELESFVLEDLQIAVGHDLRNAAAGDEQHQRRDDRLDREAGHEQPVEQAEQAGDRDRDDEGERHGEG